jgi:8-oxo-dGTP diphosphatase
MSTVQPPIKKTVGALFVGRAGKVLLGLRAPGKAVWPSHWDTIGGHVEEDESLETALIREAREEVGVIPTRFKLIATVRERNPEVYGDALHHVFALAEWRGGEPTNVCDEHTELRWFNVEEIRLLSNIVDPDYASFAQQAMGWRC